MGTRCFALSFVIASAACATPFEGVEPGTSSPSEPPAISGAESTPVPSPAPAESTATPGPAPSAPAPAPAPAQPGVSGIDIDSPDECVEKTGSWTLTVKLDPVKRLIAEYVAGKTLFAYRYDAEKRLVALAHWNQSSSPSPWDVFQRDYAYDASGHVDGSRLTYVSAPPFYVPAISTSYYAHQYVNTYDASGPLQRSVATPSGPVSTGWPTVEVLFDENAAGQCERIETRSTGPSGPTTVRIETRTYDAAGRLSRSDSSGAVGCGFMPANTTTMSTMLWTYDVQGRLTKKRFWCDGTKLDDPPGYSQTIDYLADGSQRVETLDYLTDVGPGEPVVTERSAHCAVIDAWRGGRRNALRPSTTRCSPAE